MFQLRYVASELRRRLGRTILTALGLAAGVGLVIGIVGVSQGLDEAQTKVLSPLQKVGTDVLVTRVAGAAPSDGSTPASTTTTSTTVAAAQGRGQGRTGGNAGAGGFFGAGAGGAGGPGGAVGAAGALSSDALNQADAAALLSDNDSVLTDLSKLGPAGTKFTHDFFLPATLLTFPDAALGQVAKLPGVTSATAGLTLLVQHETGTVPNISVNVTTDEQTIQQTIRPEPMTAEERQAFQQCLRDSGVQFGNGNGGGGNFGGGRDNNNTGGTGGGNTTGGTTPTGNTTPTTQRPPTSTTVRPTTTTVPATTTTTVATKAFVTAAPEQAAPPDDNPAFQDCLPARFKEYQNNVVVPAQTINRIVNPPQTDTTSASYTAAGVDPASPKAGLVTVDQVKAGRFINPGADSEVLLSVAYANKKNLDVGSTVTINDQTFNVVGLVDPALTGNTADIYFSLAKLQDLSSKPGRINEILVKASKSADVDKVAKEVSDLLPGAQVVTTKALSQQVTGSLADAKKLADRLGGALAAIVLAAVFIIAMLLTLSSVAKRVREIGTLRAVGWSKTMVVRQVLFETVAIGLLGGLMGIALGLGVAALVGVSSPSFSASATGVTASSASRLGAQLFGPAVRSGAVSTSTHLHASVHPATLLLGAGLAVAGGVLAGAVGGWRAARLSPADALRTTG